PACDLRSFPTRRSSDLRCTFWGLGLDPSSCFEGVAVLIEPSPTPYDLQFRLFGVPVRVHPFFWVTAVILGSRGFSGEVQPMAQLDRKSTRLNSSHVKNS